MFRRILAMLALAVGGAASVQCSAQSGYDGESHFFCSRDTDCTSLGADFQCVERRCVRSSGDASTTPADAARPPAAPSPLAGYVSDGSGGFRFVHVDPTTGKVTFDVPAPDVSSVVPEAAYDDISGHWFGIAGINGAPLDLRLLSVAPSDAITLSEPLAPSVSNIAVAKGTLVGVQFMSPPGIEFGALDANTGTFTFRSWLPGSAVTVGAGRTAPATGLYYILMPQMGTTLLTNVRTNLLTIDIGSGAVLHDVTTAENLTAIEVDLSERVLGFVFSSTKNELVAVDPATGATTLVASLPQVEATDTGESAIDPNAGIVYQVVSPTPSTHGLLSVELATGRATVVPLDVSFASFAVCPSCGAN